MTASPKKLRRRAKLAAMSRSERERATSRQAKRWVIARGAYELERFGLCHVIHKVIVDLTELVAHLDHRRLMSECGIPLIAIRKPNRTAP